MYYAFGSRVLRTFSFSKSQLWSVLDLSVVIQSSRNSMNQILF